MVSVQKQNYLSVSLIMKQRFDFDASPESIGMHVTYTGLKLRNVCTTTVIATTFSERDEMHL